MDGRDAQVPGWRRKGGGEPKARTSVPSEGKLSLDSGLQPHMLLSVLENQQKVGLGCFWKGGRGRPQGGGKERGEERQINWR